jgi:hypothetical protein
MPNGRSATIRNESTFPIETVEELLNSGVDINYGGMRVRVRRIALEQARNFISNFDPTVREEIRTSVERTLQCALPKMLRDKFSKKTADNFCNDLLLWEALKQ